MSNIGMMDGAYFVGRTELLGWTNSILGTNLTKIEQMQNGSIYCQLMDATHPGAVPLKKVNFAANTEYEYMNNYKVLQTVFEKLNIDKHIEVNKLMKGRPLDNTEFLQWLKRYCDSVSGGDLSQHEYNGHERRQTAKGGNAFGGGSKSTSKPKSSAPPTSNASRSKHSAPTSTTEAKSVVGKENRKGGPAQRRGSVPANGQVASLQSQVTQLKLSVDSVERERDFYFAKLRDVEILVTQPQYEDNSIAKDIQKILYASEDNPEVLAEAKEVMDRALQNDGPKRKLKRRRARTHFKMQWKTRALVSTRLEKLWEKRAILNC